ncbi:hypothetical protein FACS1894125_5860 [Actinomycetota bacterium]|nr:hypothetical protein FACS1894125_5860 [Actinomycetota bacterium]
MYSLRAIDVYYSLNAGSGSTTPVAGIAGSSSVQFGEQLLQEPGSPSRPGYDFLYWNTSADGSGITWDYKTAEPYATAANGVTFVGDTGNGSLRLYAQWSARPISVTYDVGGGTGLAGEDYSGTFDSDDLSEPDVNPEKDGWTFACWSVSASAVAADCAKVTSAGGAWRFDGSPAASKLTEANGVVISAINNTATLKLYAVYQARPVVLSWVEDFVGACAPYSPDLNELSICGGLHSYPASENGATSYPYGALGVDVGVDDLKPLTDPILPGYTFAGWVPDAVVVAANGSVSQVMRGSWAARNVHVIWDNAFAAHSASSASAGISQAFGHISHPFNAPFTLAALRPTTGATPATDPILPGYRFTGWSDGGNIFAANGTISRTFTASYTPLEVVVNYSDGTACSTICGVGESAASGGSGSVGDSNPPVFDSTLQVAPQNPKKLGLEFLGWSHTAQNVLGSDATAASVVNPWVFGSVGGSGVSGLTVANGVTVPANSNATGASASLQLYAVYKYIDYSFTIKIHEASKGDGVVGIMHCSLSETCNAKPNGEGPGPYSYENVHIGDSVRVTATPDLSKGVVLQDFNLDSGDGKPEPVGALSTATDAAAEPDWTYTIAELIAKYENSRNFVITASFRILDWTVTVNQPTAASASTGETGSITAEPGTYNFGNTIVLTANVPRGYELDRFVVTGDGYTVDGDPEGLKPTANPNVWTYVGQAGDTEVSVLFKPQAWDVKYYDGFSGGSYGAVYDGVYDSIEEPTDATYTIDVPNPTRTGYDFLGWQYVLPAGDVVNTYVAGSTIVIPPADVAFKALWQARPVTVSYSSAVSDSTVTLGAPDWTGVYDGTIPAAPTGWSREGYVLVGWSTAIQAGTIGADCAAVIASAGATASCWNFGEILNQVQDDKGATRLTTANGVTFPSGATGNGELRLYAVWRGLYSFKVVDAFAGDLLQDEQALGAGDVVAVPSSALAGSLDCRAFAGWTVSSSERAWEFDGAVVVRADEAPVVVDGVALSDVLPEATLTMPAGEVILTATWQAVKGCEPAPRFGGLTSWHEIEQVQPLVATSAQEPNWNERAIVTEKQGEVVHVSTASAGYFYPFEPVEIWVHSDPVQVADLVSGFVVNADENGDVDVDVAIPDEVDVDPDHHIVLQGLGDWTLSHQAVAHLAVQPLDCTYPDWAAANRDVCPLPEPPAECANAEYRAANAALCDGAGGGAATSTVSATGVNVADWVLLLMLVLVGVGVGLRKVRTVLY